MPLGGTYPRPYITSASVERDIPASSRAQSPTDAPLTTMATLRHRLWAIIGFASSTNEGKPIAPADRDAQVLSKWGQQTALGQPTCRKAAAPVKCLDRMALYCSRRRWSSIRHAISHHCLTASSIAAVYKEVRAITATSSLTCRTSIMLSAAAHARLALSFHAGPC